MKNLLRFILCLQIVWLPGVKAADNTAEPFTVHREDPQMKSGGVFFSSTKKNEVLFKANIWGAVQFPGVHYMPLGTRFLDAMSFAGGPIEAANTERVLLSSKAVGKDQLVIRELSVAKAMSSLDLNPVLQPDDILVVKQDRTRENITLWVTVGTFVLTAVALGIVISNNGK